MKVVWTERAWELLTEIEAFVARDHPEAAVRFVDKLIARGDAPGRYPAEDGPREIVVASYRIVYRRMPNRIEVPTVFEEHRLLREAELPEDVRRVGNRVSVWVSVTLARNAVATRNPRREKRQRLKCVTLLELLRETARARGPLRKRRSTKQRFARRERVGSLV